jgi:Transglycosylase SLT domain
MSNPANRLSSFRSYSFYHVLAMCDSSETADRLSKSNELGVWEHATDATRDLSVTDLGPYSPKKVKNAGKYIVLINGSTDASFVIEQAKWSSSTGAAAAPGDRSTSIAIEGSLKISEPKGIAFLDQVVKCSVSLGVDSAQVVYVLKTFFVGHRDDVETNQNMQDAHITDIPPVTFIVYDVTGLFNEAGGTYEMQFVAAAHGAARFPQYSKAVNAMSVTAGDSLATTLTKLQDNINSSYRQYFNCVYEQVKESSLNNEAILKSLRPVKYVIEVGKDYRDDGGQIKYTVTNQLQQYKNTSGCNDPAQVTFPAHTSIETAISTIMSMSPQVQSDMAVGDTQTKVKYEYKIHTAVVSARAGDGTEGMFDYTIYYRIERFITPKSISYNPAFAILAQDDQAINADPNYEQIRRNIIEFDYMYTGKNIDILEFDMKVNMGLAYLQTATLANTFKSQLEIAPNKVMQPSSGDLNTYPVKFGSIVQIPVFFGSQIRTPSLINTQNASHSIQSAYSLTKHSSLEVTDVTMRIMGNEQLLGSTNKTSSPEYVVATKSGSVDTSLNAGGFADWSHVPAYVKVRIKMPRENDDFALFTGQSTSGDPRTDPGITDYARDFWFDGYYYVVGIDHVFDNGEFSQTLQMLGIPKRSSYESSKSKTPTEVNPSSTVGSCYDNKIGINSSTAAGSTGNNTSTVAIPHVPPTGNTSPTNKADADSHSQSVQGLSDVVGWDNASKDVKDAILDAATRYGVDPVTLARIASHESRFAPGATNPSSSATGLYQIINQTWAGLVRQGKVFGVTSTVPDLRTDPVFNARGGAAYLKDNAAAIGSSDVGDLYLAHFLGTPRAKLIISSDRQTGGSALLLTTLGTPGLNAVMRANPTIVKPNTTVGELRAWAAKVMAATIKKGIATSGKTSTTGNKQQGSTSPNDNAASSKGRTADGSLSAATDWKIRSSTAQPCGPVPSTGK